ncbi:MAG: hypothetical protein ACXACI_07870 [Candidatus Hodarchaeales archaeon]|jgi:hypothetical protein
MLKQNTLRGLIEKVGGIFITAEMANNHLGLLKQRSYVLPVVLVVLSVGMASGVQRAALALYAKDFSGEQVVAGSYLQIALSLTG